MYRKIKMKTHLVFIPKLPSLNIYISCLFTFIIFLFTHLLPAYIQFSDLLHSAPMMGLDRIKSKVKVTDCRKRLHQLSDSVKVNNKIQKQIKHLRD